MPRFTTDDNISEIFARIPDNDVGTVTPEVLRNMLTDIVMTLRGTGAYVAGTVPVAHNFSTTAFQQVPNLYTTGVTRDPSEILANIISGDFTALWSADYSVRASFSMEGASNERVILGIAIDGVVSPYFKTEIALAGAGNLSEVNIEGVVRANVGQKIAVWFSTPTAPTSVTISNPATSVALIPSRV